MNNNEKFEELTNFLKIVPEEEPEEKELMNEIDNDKEEQSKVKEIIQEKEERLSCEELNEIMKYILLKDYFCII